VLADTVTTRLVVATTGAGLGACGFSVVEVGAFEQLKGHSPERLIIAMMAICDAPMPDWEAIARPF
jgi:hypothetical protein